MSDGNREDDAFLGGWSDGQLVSLFFAPHLNGKFIYIIIFILYIDKSFILPF
jgi:hypothetical protein